MKHLNIYGVISLGALMLAPMSVAAAPAVTNFTVVNADTGADIASFTSSGTISVKNTPNINLRANATGVKSVVFTDATTTTRIESSAPYAYKGNAGPTYFKWTPSAGTYVINAKPFDGSGGKGVAGAVATLTLKITNDAVQTTPVPPVPPTTAGNQVFQLSYQAAPVDNPLKGFLPYAPGSKNGWNAGQYLLPHSMEWFYIPLKDIQNGENSFDWIKLEDRLKAIAARGNQAAFRVYLDYPGSSVGVPAFLSSALIYNNGKSPNYDDPAVQKALLNFIAAFGARYDGDPRIGFITAGLLGYWGEWHVYPAPGSQMASQALQTKVVDAYDKAFTKTHVQYRGPVKGTDVNRSRGFHDDSFAYTTIGTQSWQNWYFWPGIIKAGLTNFWKTSPMGGEVRPEIQGCMWDNSCTKNKNQSFSDSVATTHATWMLNEGNVKYKATGAILQSILAGVQSMGYTLHVPTASVNSPSVGQALTGSVTIENRGVAPFYYPWTVQMAARDSVGKLYTWPQQWDLRLVLPGSPSVLNFNVAKPGLSAGNYTLMIGVPNPMSGGKPLKFGNTTQDKDVNGWLTLGSFTVK
jgi:Domain of unknown function (DUF4832)